MCLIRSPLFVITDQINTDFSRHIRLHFAKNIFTIRISKTPHSESFKFIYVSSKQTSNFSPRAPFRFYILLSGYSCARTLRKHINLPVASLLGIRSRCYVSVNNSRICYRRANLQCRQILSQLAKNNFPYS